jgi:histidyl-tRNA synthetase
MIEDNDEDDPDEEERESTIDEELEKMEEQEEKEKGEKVIRTEDVKGFRDFADEEALKREKILEILIKKFKLYGFMPAETPIIEYEGFVKGNNPDGSISDIFKLKDRGERKLALRNEFTFQLKRIVLNKKLPFRRYQIGEVFRDEPISANRFRQFTQCDVDVVGSTTRDEAEILKLADEILKALNIDAIIYFNNRNFLNEILKKEGIQEENWLLVLKELDRIDKLGEEEVKKSLAKYHAESIPSILKNNERFFEKYYGYKEVQELKRYCELFNVQVKFNPYLTRGISYYNGSVFEIKSSTDTIIVGGSYYIGKNQSAGISLRLEKLTSLAKLDVQGSDCLIISIAMEKEAIKLMEKLRKENISCILGEKVSKGLDYANRTKIRSVIFLGEEESNKNQFKLRDMVSGEEKMLDERELIKTLKELK